MTTKSMAYTEKFSAKVVKYFKGTWSELKKTHWPSRKELTVYTGVVLVSVLIVAAAIWVIDSLFATLLSLFY